MNERKNVTWEYKQLSTKELCVDELYQRPINQQRVNRIVKNYDICLVNPVKVSFRDGKYWIFDGDHTVAAEKKKRGKGKDVVVDCKVFYGLSRLDEMELFTAQNGESASVAVGDKLRALYNFGDKDVVNMVQNAQAAGIRIDFTKTTAQYKVTAVGTLLKISMRMKREPFIDMLNVLRNAWDGIPDSFCREILVGMEAFYTNFYGKFKAKDLIKSLTKITPMFIVREGKNVGASAFAANAYMNVILRVYNNGRKTTRLSLE